jgi:hypothetical protein
MHFPIGYKQVRLFFRYRQDDRIIKLNLADFVEERTGFPLEREREWRGSRPTSPPKNSLPRRPR